MLTTISSIKAQILTWNISTGFDAGWALLAPGGVDAHWTLMQTPGSGPINDPAFATNGLLWNGTNLSAAWGATPGCCRWLCPNVVVGGLGNGAGNFVEPTSNPAWDPGQVYIYEYHFNNPTYCCVTNPKFLFTAFMCDDEAQLELNGTTYTIPGGFNSGIIPIMPTDINCGTNILRVKVSNSYGFATGFRICGRIEADATPITCDLTCPTEICMGSPITIDGSASTGPIQSYFLEIAECDALGNYTNPSAVWSNAYTGSPGMFTFPPLSFLQCNKYYKVKLAVANNCSTWVETNKVLFVQCTPVANAGPDRIICPANNNGSVTIGGGPIAPNCTYSWSPTNGLTNPNSPNPGVEFCLGNTIGCVRDGTCSAEKTYTVTVTRDNGCSSTDVVTVTYINQGPDPVTFIQEDPDLCQGITLTAVPNCDMACEYKWFPSEETTQSIVVSPNTANSSYTVVVTSPCFSSSTASITLSTTLPILEGPPPHLTSYRYVSTTVPMIIFDDDIWTPYAPYAYNAYQYQLNVWDRWGNLVWTKIDNVAMTSTGFWNGQIQWDGTDLNGNYVQVDSYTYGLRLRNCSSSCPEFKSAGLTSPWDDPDECDAEICVYLTADECRHKNARDITWLPDRTGCIYCDYRQSVDVLEGEEKSMQVNSANGEENMTLTPNPNYGNFSVTIESQSDKTVLLSIFDVSGRIFHTEPIYLQKGENKTMISKPGLPAGVYFVRVDGFEEPVKMIVIE